MDVHLDSSTPPPDPTQAPPLDLSPHLTSNAVSSPLQNNTEWEKPEEPVKTRSSKRLRGNFEVIFPDLRPALKIFHVMTILVFLKQLPHVDQIHPTLVPFLLNIYAPLQMVTVGTMLLHMAYRWEHQKASRLSIIWM